MQLPLENTFDRNATKRAILDGHFTNLRISLFPPTEVMDGAMNASDMYSPTRVGGPWYPVATRLPGKPLPEHVSVAPQAEGCAATDLSTCSSTDNPSLISAADVSTSRTTCEDAGACSYTAAVAQVDESCAADGLNSAATACVACAVGYYSASGTTICDICDGDREVPNYCVQANTEIDR